MKKLSVVFISILLIASSFAFYACGDSLNAGDGEAINEQGVTVLFNDDENGAVPLPADATTDAEYDKIANATYFFEFEPYGTADNRAYQITGFSSTTSNRPTEIVFPNTYKNRPIIGIKQGAFRDDTTITSIRVGADMKFIGKRAFLGCSNLTSVNIPIVAAFTPSSTSLSKDEYAAEFTTYYKASSGIIKLGAHAFGDTAITTFTIPTNTYQLSGNLFEGCTKLTSIVFHSDVMDIGAQAFQGCTALTSLDMSALTGKIKVSYVNTIAKFPSSTAGLSTIGTAIFKNCFALTSVKLPRGVETIPTSAFANCAKLSSCTVVNITTVGEGAFYNCEKLESIVLDDDASIGATAFSGCPAGAEYGA